MTSNGWVTIVAIAPADAAENPWIMVECPLEDGGTKYAAFFKNICQLTQNIKK